MKKTIINVYPFTKFTENKIFNNFKKNILNKYKCQYEKNSEFINYQNKIIKEKLMKAKTIEKLFENCNKYLKDYYYENCYICKYLKEEWKKYILKFTYYDNIYYYEKVLLFNYKKQPFYDLKTWQIAWYEPFWLLNYFIKNYWEEKWFTYLSYVNSKNYDEKYFEWDKIWEHYYYIQKWCKYKLVVEFKDYTYNNWKLIAKFETKYLDSDDIYL